jgi:hypothetical protein
MLMLIALEEIRMVTVLRVVSSGGGKYISELACVDGHDARRHEDRLVRATGSFSRNDGTAG